jgi:hypothetical protein
VTATNRTGAAFVDQRPNRVCDGRDDALAGNLRNNGFKQFATECFQIPGAAFFGTAGRNILNAPGVNNFDLGIHKFFRFSEQMRLQFRAEMFNAFNHANFAAPNTLANSPNFGLVSAARAPRLIQWGGKILF